MSRHAAILCAALLLTGCQVNATAVTTATASPVAIVNPVIQAIASNPGSVAHKGDAITFTVVAYAPDGAPLQYTWAATKGTLSATAGQAVSWTPQRSDGSLESGTATIQVILSNGKGGIAQSSVNVQIAADGSAVATVPTATPSPVATAALAPASTPSAAAPSTHGANLVFDGYTFHRHLIEPNQGEYGDNGDNVIQRGETVALDFKLKNTGTSSTQRIYGVLSTHDPLIKLSFSPSYKDITDGGVFPPPGTLFSDLEPGQTLGGDDLAVDTHQAVNGAWEISGWIFGVSKDCPAGHQVGMTLDASDKYGNSWTSDFIVEIQ